MSRITRTMNLKTVMVTQTMINKMKRSLDPYDIREIFDLMTLELVISLRKSMAGHKAQELREGFQWEQWQAVKLRNIRNYRKANQATVGSYSKEIEKVVDEVLQKSYKAGGDRVQKAIEQTVKQVPKKVIPDVIETKPVAIETRPTVTVVEAKPAVVETKSGDIKLPGGQEKVKSSLPGKEIDTSRSVSSSTSEPHRRVGKITKVSEPHTAVKKLGKITRTQDPAKTSGLVSEPVFFEMNEKKLQALQDSVEGDLGKAQHAVLRQMDDVYRQTIYKAQMHMASGTKTLNQAVDMATKDFLDKGIRCIEYKNGRRVDVASYAEMALRTASQRATFLGEGQKRDEWGIYTIFVSAHATACKLCVPWQAKVLIDDVFTSLSADEAKRLSQELGYPLLSKAMEAGLLHPNCRHTLATYFPGITQLPEVPDAAIALANYKAEQKQRYMERQIRKWKRREVGSLDPENRAQAAAWVKEWQRRIREHLKENPQLRRDSWRERLLPDAVPENVPIAI